MRVKERTERLTGMRIHIESSLGNSVPNQADLIADYEDGREYIGRDYIVDYRSVRTGREAELARMILEEEGCKPPKTIKLERHYLHDETLDRTFCFYLPLRRYVENRKG